LHFPDGYGSAADHNRPPACQFEKYRTLPHNDIVYYIQPDCNTKFEKQSGWQKKAGIDYQK
jgi:hypothetical protein